MGLVLAVTGEPTKAQRDKIAKVESTLFQFFKGKTEEEAERFIATYYPDAVRLSVKLGMSKKRKARNNYNGLPIRLKG